MTIEQKIARDIIRSNQVTYYSGLWQQVQLEHFLTCKQCLPRVEDNLLIVELINQTGLIPDEQVEGLKVMLKSSNNSDIDLARELINNLRTKRLKHGNTKSIKQTH